MVSPRRRKIRGKRRERSDEAEKADSLSLSVCRKRSERPRSARDEEKQENDVADSTFSLSLFLSLFVWESTQAFSLLRSLASSPFSLVDTCGPRFVYYGLGQGPEQRGVRACRLCDERQRHSIDGDAATWLRRRKHPGAASYSVLGVRRPPVHEREKSLGRPSEGTRIPPEAPVAAPGSRKDDAQWSGATSSRHCHLAAPALPLEPRGLPARRRPAAHL